MSEEEKHVTLPPLVLIPRFNAKFKFAVKGGAFVIRKGAGAPVEPGEEEQACGADNEE